MATIDYNDKRLTQVTAQEKADIAKLESSYDSAIEESNQHYDKLIDATAKYAEEEAQRQQERSDLAIEKLEQQKADAEKDYIKEQKGAYVDWQKQSDQYGVNAEQMASQGLTGTGYSESSQVSMYNTYQNRVATAREVHNRAVLGYDTAMAEARQQNSSILAEIAYNALVKGEELAIQQINTRNALISEKTDKIMATKSLYQSKWQSVLNQINTENALAEQQRQFDLSMEWEREQFYNNPFAGVVLEDNPLAYPVSETTAAERFSNPVYTASDNSSTSRNVGGRSFASTQSGDASEYIQMMAKAGKTKSQIKAEIDKAVKAGELTEAEAKALKKQYT